MGKKNKSNCTEELKEKCQEGKYCTIRSFSMKKEDGPNKYKPKERAKFAAKMAIKEGYIPLKKNGTFVAPKGGGKGHILAYKCYEAKILDAEELVKNVEEKVDAEEIDIFTSGTI